MKTARHLCLFVMLLALAAVAQMPFFFGPPPDPLDTKIVAEIKDHAKLMDNLEFLTDMIGSRLTGGPQLKRADEWALAKFKEYGLSNVHAETTTIANGWERVSARARVIEPAQHPLTIAAAGWSPSTKGLVRGPVVLVTARTPEEMEQYKGKLKNAIILTPEMRRGLPLPGAPGAPGTPGPEAQRERARQVPAPAAPEAQPDMRRRMEDYREMQRKRDEFFKNEGVAAMLRRSDKDYGLLNMTGGSSTFEISAIPSAFLTSEGYLLLERLMKRGPVMAEIEIVNKIVPGPVEVANIVADIPGSEKPDEVVLLGAHLDSWDLGTGSNDNGTGSTVIMEAARALKALELKPKRTIRFVLFWGEEEGLLGSREYVRAHKNDLGKISAVLVHDTGTGKVTSIGLSGDYAARETMDQVIAPLRGLGLALEEPSMRSMGGTDHASFVPEGVPGFWCIQDPLDYRQTHHSQADTFDKARTDDLIQGAQVLAVVAYKIANLPQMLPRQPRTQSEPRP
jgi:carboxypeptidase Q